MLNLVGRRLINSAGCRPLLNLMVLIIYIPNMYINNTYDIHFVSTLNNLVFFFYYLLETRKSIRFSYTKKIRIQSN